MRFVVQEHNARKAGLHWDFRLEDPECEGNFLSWVIPKLTVKQRCKLAIKVADHSEECAYFEGTYAPGYGEGTVKIWDEGTCKFTEEDHRKIKFQLDGEKLNGSFLLTRKKGSEEHWFLIQSEW